MTFLAFACSNKVSLHTRLVLFPRKALPLHFLG